MNIWIKLSDGLSQCLTLLQHFLLWSGTSGHILFCYIFSVWRGHSAVALKATEIWRPMLWWEESTRSWAAWSLLKEPCSPSSSCSCSSGSPGSRASFPAGPRCSSTRMGRKSFHFPPFLLMTANRCSHHLTCTGKRSEWSQLGELVRSPAIQIKVHSKSYLNFLAIQTNLIWNILDTEIHFSITTKLQRFYYFFFLKKHFCSDKNDTMETSGDHTDSTSELWAWSKVL